jgi:hypothetical protein
MKVFTRLFLSRMWSLMVSLMVGGRTYGYPNGVFGGTRIIKKIPEPQILVSPTFQLRDPALDTAGYSPRP